MYTYATYAHVYTRREEPRSDVESWAKLTATMRPRLNHAFLHLPITQAFVCALSISDKCSQPRSLCFQQTIAKWSNTCFCGNVGVMLITFEHLFGGFQIRSRFFGALRWCSRTCLYSTLCFSCIYHCKQTLVVMCSAMVSKRENTKKLNTDIRSQHL